MIDVSGRTCMLALTGGNTIDPPSSREVSIDASVLIRIADEIGHALSSTSEVNAESAAVDGDLLRNPAAAENQRVHDFGQLHNVRIIEQDAIKPFLQSTVILSALALRAVERTVRSAAREVHT